MSFTGAATNDDKTKKSTAKINFLDVLKRLVLILFSSCAVTAADFAIKKAVKANIAPLAEGKKFIPKVIDFYYAQNTGAAWGIFSGKPNALTFFTSLLLLALIILFAFGLFSSRLAGAGVALVVGGGVANAFDRVMFGFVTDYIRTLFVNFPIYNLADIFIVCGASLLVVSYIIEIIKESSLKKKKGEKEESKAETKATENGEKDANV